MIFLEVSDLSALIKEDVLNQVISNRQDILLKAEQYALEEMQSYLRNRFDVPTIFARTGNDRNALLVMYLTDMTLYHVHSRINPRQIPELRGIRYEAALDWLRGVMKGELVPDLPKVISETEPSPTGQITNVGEVKRQNRY